MDANNWRDYIETVGIIAVVASLLLLGYEIRQTRQAILGEAYSNRVNTVSDANLAFVDSPFLPAIDVKYHEQGIEALTLEERLRFFTDAQAALYRSDGVFYQYQLGLIDEDYYQNHAFQTIRTFKKRWQELGLLAPGRIRPAFKAEVERATLANYIEQAERAKSE